MDPSSTHPDIDLWRQLLAPRHEPLRESLQGGDLADLGLVTRLRRDLGVELAGVALLWAKGQRKLALKFPGETMVGDPVGVEQASSRCLADYKARRFQAASPRRIVDLCCGVGGDAMSFARVAEEVIAVDLSPLRVWMTQQNARCDARVGDVEQEIPDADLFHIDPDRRDSAGGGRLWNIEDYRPNDEFLLRLLDERRDGAIKLGPGIDIASLPSAAHLELEFVSEQSRLVQAILWSGCLAEGARRATRLPDGVTLVGEPSYVASSEGDVGRFLFEPDPALERAGLIGSVANPEGMLELHTGLGLFSGERSSSLSESWFRRYDVVETFAWRDSDVKRRLRKLDAGVVDVKTRGGAIDANAMQRTLSGSGARHLVVFGLRLGRKKIAIVTEPRETA